MHNINKLKGFKNCTPNLRALIKAWNNQNSTYTPERLLGIICREYGRDRDRGLGEIVVDLETGARNGWGIYYTVLGLPFGADDVLSLQKLLAANGLTDEIGLT